MPPKNTPEKLMVKINASKKNASKKLKVEINASKKRF